MSPETIRADVVDATQPHDIYWAVHWHCVGLRNWRVPWP